MATTPKQYKQGGNGSYGALNAKYNFLQTQLANLSGSGGTQDLTSVLTLGNSAGNLDITNVDNIDVVTINGSAYPPVVGSDTLEQVLTAGNEADQVVIIKDNLTTPTTSHTVTYQGANIIGDGTNGLGINMSVGVPLTNGSASANLSATNDTASALSLVCAGIETPPNPASNASATLQATPTTSLVQLLQSTPFSPTYQMTMDLNNITHNCSSDTQPLNINSNGNINLDYGAGKSVVLNSGGIGTITTLNDMYLNAGSYPTGKVWINKDQPNYEMYMNNNAIRSSQIGAPSFYSEFSTSQIVCSNLPTSFAYMTYQGYSIGGGSPSQTTSLQLTQLLSTNDFTIKTQTTGDISITAIDQIKLKASDTGGTGSGIYIDKATPNLYYQMNTANANDRLVLDNNGAIESVSVTNQQACSMNSGTVILQDFTSQRSLDLTAQSISWSNQATPAQSSYHAVNQLGFNAVGGINSVLSSANLTIVNPTAGSGGVSSLSSNGLTISNNAVGGASAPMLTLTNTNATGSVATEIYKNKPTAGANGDVLYTQSVYGKDSGNVKQEYTRITHTIRDATAGAEDGSLELGCFVNGGFANFIQLNANDAPIGEVNFTRPLDFIGGSDANSTIKTSGLGSVNLNLDATTSNGTGAIALKTKDGVAGSGGGLLLTGNTLLSGSAGGNSGQHLCLTIGGTVYKIKLENA